MITDRTAMQAETNIVDMLTPELRLLELNDALVL